MIYLLFILEISLTFFTIEFEGISFVTIAPAAIVTLSPIVIGPIIIQPYPNIQLSPIIACLLSLFMYLSLSPLTAAIIAAYGYILQLLPIIAVLPIVIPCGCDINKFFLLLCGWLWRCFL